MPIVGYAVARRAPLRAWAPLLFALCSALAAGRVGAESLSPRVAMQTTLGALVIELDASAAPTTVANFLRYVDEGFYAGTLFHRVIPGFVIQGGGFDADMVRKATREPIDNEADNGLRNRAYTLSMARTRDPHSATSQFFINLADNSNLDHRGPSGSGWGYAVFGRVVEGREVVEAIAAAETGVNGGLRDVPQTPIMIESAQRVAAEPLPATAGEDAANGAEQ